MAAILAARKLSQLEGGQAGRTPAKICAIADAVRYAEEILKEIDHQWPNAGYKYERNA